MEPAVSPLQTIHDAIVYINELDSIIEYHQDCIDRLKYKTDILTQRLSCQPTEQTNNDIFLHAARHLFELSRIKMNIRESGFMTLLLNCRQQLLPQIHTIFNSLTFLQRFTSTQVLPESLARLNNDINECESKVSNDIQIMITLKEDLQNILFINQEIITDLIAQKPNTKIKDQAGSTAEDYLDSIDPDYLKILLETGLAQNKYTFLNKHNERNIARALRNREYTGR